MLSVAKDIKQLYGCIFPQEKRSDLQHNNWFDYLAMRREKDIYLSALLLMLIANCYSYDLALC